MEEVLGKLQGIKKNILASLEALYAERIPQDQLFTEELALTLRNISASINKEIVLLISRSGKVESVSVGGSNVDAHMPALEIRRGKERLSGLRCIHTHPDSSSALSAPDLSALRSSRFDAMVALGWSAQEAEIEVSVGLITDCNEQGQLMPQAFGPYTMKEALSINLTNLLNTLEKLLAQKSQGHSLIQTEERAVLMSLDWQQKDMKWSPEDSLEELALLTQTAGAKVVGSFLQKRPKPDPAYFLGWGKVQEIAKFIQNTDANLCICDEELGPAQNRNLETALGIRVLDRTALILDIFAGRAQSNEGKLQVELAQLKYSLPRIMGQGASLSRLGGGIGTRGPGETKLEVDRRKIRDRISFLENQIDKLCSVRALHRTKRVKNNVAQICLVGYTNAGKSTLLNTLTAAEAYVQNQLFATLDTTTRVLLLPNKQEVILTDTVGFIQRLPHQLVAAFKSTLEEVKEADLLLHVVDYSNTLYKEQEEAVHLVLKELGADNKPLITVYNKLDNLEGEGLEIQQEHLQDNMVYISCKQKRGLEDLLELISLNLNLTKHQVKLLLPYSESALAAKLHDSATVLNEDYGAEGIVMEVVLSKQQQEAYQGYIINEGDRIND